MSKKVVHLADDAHELAKAFCKDSGMKMSDWVAMLIKRAVEPGKPSAAPQAMVAQTFASQAPVQHYEQSYATRAEHYGRIPDTTPARVAAASAPAVQQPTFNPRAVTTAVAPADRANQTVRIGDAVHGVIPKKKAMVRELSGEEEATPVYAQPPFWARAKG